MCLLLNQNGNKNNKKLKHLSFLFYNVFSVWIREENNFSIGISTVVPKVTVRLCDDTHLHSEQ